MVWHAACPGSNDDQLLHYAVYDVSEQQQVGIPMPIVVTKCMCPIVVSPCACMNVPLPYVVHPAVITNTGKLSPLLIERALTGLLMLCTAVLCHAQLYCTFTICGSMHALLVCSHALRLL